MEALREQLTEARSRGEDFAECWPGAVKAVLSTMRPPLRGEWRRCLERTRETWERCYERVQATPAELALEQAHILTDREPLPDRACVECDGRCPLPVTDDGARGSARSVGERRSVTATWVRPGSASSRT